MQELSQTRSNFVTVLAWIFIALTGFATFISLLQNIMLNVFFPLDKMTSTLQSPDGQHIPPLFRLMFENIRLVFLGFFVVTSVTLIASIGLLRRKNWARLLFIGLMVFGIVWSLGGIVLQQFLFGQAPKSPLMDDPGFALNFTHMLLIIKIASAVIALGMSLFFGWIIRKLSSPGVRTEFGR